MIDRDYFFDKVRENLIHKLAQSQVDGLTALLDAWEKHFSSKPLSYLAYCLATAYHETAFTLQPIKEYGLGKGHPYGKPAGDYGKAYYGRGYVQLTWLDNYKKAQTKLSDQYDIDVELVKNPELALDPTVAALILFDGSIEGWFTGKKLSNYFDGGEDAVHARRIINGLDKAQTIASYYTVFSHALKG